MRVTDGQMDRQNYDPQDGASIAALCGKMAELALFYIIKLLLLTICTW